MEKDEIEAYLDTDYIGFIKGQYDNCCPLKYDEINNFVQNVGKYYDLEIVNEEGQEILFDTYGQFINRIWPELSSSDRDSFRTDINAIAGTLVNKFYSDDSTEPIDKVKDFIDNTIDMNNEFKLKM